MGAELNSKLTEMVREVKFLENENLQLMLECKEVKKQSSQYRAELEALHKQTKKSPDALNLAAPSPAQIAKGNPFSSSADRENAAPADAAGNSLSTKKARRVPASLDATSGTGDGDPAECK